MPSPLSCRALPLLCGAELHLKCLLKSLYFPSSCIDGPCLQDCEDRDVVVQQGARRQHGSEVEQQIRVALKLLRQSGLECVLEGWCRRGGNAVPPLGRTPVVVVDCSDKTKLAFRPLSTDGRQRFAKPAASLAQGIGRPGVQHRLHPVNTVIMRQRSREVGSALE